MGVKWGILGTASIARYATIPGMKKAENCELYAIAGRNLNKAEDFKNEFGFEKAYGSYEELLKDPEVQAVYIPLPNHIHCEWVIKALDAGKNVLCEKPLAMNSAETERMFEAARRNKVTLMEAYAYLHSPYIESLRNDVKSGIIGNVDFIDTAFITQGYKEDFRLHKEFGGGAMYDLGCYCTTMILSLIESEVKDVHASADFENGVDFLTVASLKFENGARASFTVGMSLGSGTNGRYDRLYIHGTKGSITSPVEYNQEGEVSYTISAEGKTSVRRITVPQNYALEVEQMNACILKGEKPHISGEFSLKNMQVIDAVLEKIGY